MEITAQSNEGCVNATVYFRFCSITVWDEAKYTHWDSGAESQHFTSLNVTFLTCADTVTAVSFSFMIYSHPFLIII